MDHGRASLRDHRLVHDVPVPRDGHAGQKNIHCEAIYIISLFSPGRDNPDNSVRGVPNPVPGAHRLAGRAHAAPR